MSTKATAIAWPSVITILSAAILIAAEVFGGAFAGGWALGVLFGLGETGTWILQGAFGVLGVLAMIAFLRRAQEAEPFRRRS